MKRFVSHSFAALLALAAPRLLLAQHAPADNGNTAPGEPAPDPRVGLKAGWYNAGTAAWNLRLLSSTPRAASLVDDSNPGDFGFMNSDLAFKGHYVFQGNFSGLQIFDVTNPMHPTRVRTFVCPEAQSDVSVFHNLLFVSGESNNGRLDCGTEGVQDTVSAARLRGVRVFDITDIAHPRQVAAVQTCRGSHTHTLVVDPNDSANVYIYVSGSAPVRSPNELAGCSRAMPDQDPNTALFRIEVIQVPVAHPEQAHIVSSPRIFDSLTAPPTHGMAPEDSARNAQMAAEARAHGAFVVTMNDKFMSAMMGREVVLPPQFVNPMLDSIVRARQGTGVPTAADSQALRDALPGIVQRLVGSGTRHGPTQCHDITVYPQVGLAGGACEGYGLLLDIHDVAHPRRLYAASDSNFSYWHSATFSNDGTKAIFTDEWGGGLQPRCRASDRREWGADAVFTIEHDSLRFHSYYKLPAPQSEVENCVAHNGSLIPVPGRDIMAQAWYQGGVSVFDFTNPDHPEEIAYFDRGPMDSTKIVGAGEWSAYWYDGHLYGSEIARGLDIFDLVPSALLTQNEIDAAKLAQLPYLNVQSQPKYTWPAAFVVARAYLDQLERDHALDPAKLSATRAALARAERARGSARHQQLSRLSATVHGYMAASTEGAKVHQLGLVIGQIQ